MLRAEDFKEGQEIIRQGEKGNTFYLFESGQAKAFIHGDKGEVEVPLLFCVGMLQIAVGAGRDQNGCSLGLHIIFWGG